MLWTQILRSINKKHNGESINATNVKMPLRPNDRAPFPPSSLSTILSLAKTGIIQDSIAFTAGLQRVEQSMTLVVKCRGCGYVFPSMVQIDQLEYGKTAILEDRTETCPKCGKTSSYNTEDYWFQS